MSSVHASYVTSSVVLVQFKLSCFKAAASWFTPLASFICYISYVFTE